MSETNEAQVKKAEHAEKQSKTGVGSAVVFQNDAGENLKAIITAMHDNGQVDLCIITTNRTCVEKGSGHGMWHTE